MKIKYHRHFEKQYQKLPTVLQSKVRLATSRFTRNPLDPRLKNHALAGQLKGFRAFSVTGDIRIIFEQHGSYTLVIFLSVGTHSQVYK